MKYSILTIRVFWQPKSLFMYTKYLFFRIREDQKVIIWPSNIMGRPSSTNVPTSFIAVCCVDNTSLTESRVSVVTGRGEGRVWTGGRRGSMVPAEPPATLPQHCSPPPATGLTRYRRKFHWVKSFLHEFTIDYLLSKFINYVIIESYLCHCSL